MYIVQYITTALPLCLPFCLSPCLFTSVSSMSFPRYFFSSGSLSVPLSLTSWVSFPLSRSSGLIQSFPLRFPLFIYPYVTPLISTNLFPFLYSSILPLYLSSLCLSCSVSLPSLILCLSICLSQYVYTPLSPLCPGFVFPPFLPRLSFFLSVPCSVSLMLSVSLCVFSSGSSSLYSPLVSSPLYISPCVYTPYVSYI